MLPGMAVHAIQRGNNRGVCFFSDEDRAFYLFHLARALPRAKCRLHAYCLMTNHVHLLLTADDLGGCGLLMKSIGQLYAQYINKTYERCGNLWEGRFKSCLVQSEQYVLACYRYIELNPVRAGLVARADQYAWSSYRINAKGEASELTAPHEEYLRLGRTPGERQAAYRDLFGRVHGDRLEEIRSATNTGYVLGTASFKALMARTLGRRVEMGSPGRRAQKAKAIGQLDLLKPE
jgi:REP-associated tyrosine transposase